MARPERFERPTHGFEARCSIQLSYGRAQNCYTQTLLKRASANIAKEIKKGIAWGMPKPSVAFVLGAPRSGTTLLQRMIGAYPSVYAYPEPHVLTPLYHMGYYQRVRVTDDDVVNTSQAFRAFVDVLPGGEEDYLEALRAYTHVLYAKALAAHPGKTLFVDKTPAYTRYPSFIQKLYPKAPCVVITRHPWAVLHSVAHSFFQGDFAQAHAHMPVLQQYVPALATWLKTPGCLHVRYETLLENPGETMLRVTQHLGLSYDASYLHYGEFPFVKSAYGDPYTVHRETKPEKNYADVWQHTFHQNPQMRAFCLQTLQSLNPSDLEVLGYSVESLKHVEQHAGQRFKPLQRRWSFYGFKRTVLLWLRVCMKVGWMKKALQKIRYYIDTVLREDAF